MCSLLLVLYAGQPWEESCQQADKREEGSTSTIWNKVCWSNHVFTKNKLGLGLGMKVESRFLLVIYACII
jgi:hypothetical protein